MGEADEIVKMCDAHLKYGTTSILPTTLASPIPKLLKAAESIDNARKKCKANILGVHFEGPFLSKKMCGAQSAENLLIPDETDYTDLISVKNLRMMGIAPELSGAFELAAKLTEKNVTVSIAHSDADFDTAEQALNSRFSDVTHIYCACSANRKEGAFRQAGVVEAGLYCDCTVQVIADLKHLPVGILKLLYKCKGADAMYLVTDGLEFSACKVKNGETVIQKNGVEVVIENGVMMTKDKEKLAGSIATMNSLVRNMYKTVGIPLYDAVKMATATPAKVIGEKHKGKVKKGFDADIILFDDNIDIKSVFVGGEKVK